MKKISVIAICCISILFFACQKKTEFIINGKVTNADGVQKVYLLTTDSLGQMLPVDSTFLNESQEFELKSKAVQPEFCQLKIGQRSYLLIAENGDDIIFKADLKDAGGNYEVKGSEESEKITEYSKITSDYSSKTGRLAEEYSKLITNNQNNKDSIIAEFNQKSTLLSSPFLKKSYQFIVDNKKSLSAFYAANVMVGMNASDYEDKLVTYSKDALNNFPNNKAVASFAKQMELAEKVLVGAQAPEIVALTPEGKTLKLSDFKGKFVLLDFWASWCGPCRQENPNIVKDYKLYKSKNFTVLGFSLDDNAEAWKKAIKDDNLAWNHFSELQQWSSPAAQVYNINAIPSSFIIDPNGKIVAKNLRGKALGDFLKTHL